MIQQVRQRMAKLGTICLSLFVLAYGATAAPADVPDRSLAGQEFDCLMEARVVIKLGAAVNGLISKVHVDRGDIVKEGQVVADMEADVQSANVSLRPHPSREQFPNARAYPAHRVSAPEGRSGADLRKTEAASAVSLDEAQTEAKISESSAKEAELNWQVAQAELKREEAVLNQRSIKNPVDGIVTERVMFSGEYRHDTNHLMTIVQIDRLNIEAFLPVSLYGQLALGMEAEVRPEAPIGGFLPRPRSRLSIACWTQPVGVSVCASRCQTRIIGCLPGFAAR